MFQCLCRELDYELYKNCFCLLLTLYSVSMTNDEKSLEWNLFSFSSYKPKRFENTSKFEGLGLSLVAYKKVYKFT